MNEERRTKNEQTILLINPRTDDMITTELPGFVSKEVGRFPPLGLLQLAATLRDHGHAVSVIDMPARACSYADLAAPLTNTTPSFVGITGTTHNLVEIQRAAQTVKTALPDTTVCLGGPHVDAFPREATEMPNIDYTIRGEGERPLPALIDALARGQRTPDIRGVGYVSEGTTHVPDPAEPPADLDQLPIPARDLIDPKDYFYVLGHRSTFTTIITTRGCPCRCIFCSTPHGKHRARSPEHIIREIEACLDQGSEEFHFVDDTFNIQKDRLETVSRAFLDHGLSARWSVRARADHLTEEGIRLAKQAGCIRIHLGVETGTDEGLQSLRKGITRAQVEQALAWTRKHRLTSAAYFMLGCPHEQTKQDVLDTIRFACRTDPDYALFNILTIYPHTELHEMAVARGLADAKHWSDFARNPTPDFNMRFWEEHFSRDELVHFLRLAYRKFYLRPRPIWRNLRSLSSPAELRHKAAAGLGILFGRP